MRPILFRCGFLSVPSYTFMMYVGVVIGVYVELFLATLRGIHSGRVVAATVILLVPAFAGARLLFVATHWRQFRNRRRILRAADGGAAMFGGLLLAIPVSIPLLSALGIPFAAFWDVACFPILIGMFFTRIGCFLNGCCAGRRSPSWFSIYLPDARGIWERRLPAQLFECAVALVLLAMAIVVWSSHPLPGLLFFLVITAYGAARALLECTRQQQISVRGVRLNRAISACCVFAGAVGYAILVLS
jgi:phosphatidylglycerol---prolipoprotein diacylglyceryl transferase